MKKKATKKKIPGKKKSSERSPTVIWGHLSEKDFIKAPRSLIHLHRYLPNEAKEITAREQILLLVLASRKFEDKLIRAYWEELGEDLGVSKETVRKWAYKLEKRGLIRIRRHRGRDPERNQVGIRNERNSFDIQPFVDLVEKAAKIRKRDKKKYSEGAEQ